MITVELTLEQLGMLQALLEHVKAEHVPINRRPNMIEQAFGNGIDSILRQLELAKAN